MPTLSPSHCQPTADSDLLARIRKDAAGKSFPPRSTVRCIGEPAFRSQLARDIGCLLDVDPTVVSWTCLPLVLRDYSNWHVTDVAVTRTSGIDLIDAVPTNKNTPLPLWVPAAAHTLGHGYQAQRDADIREGFRLENARDLLRYSSLAVSLGDRVRLLALLDEHESMPLAVCMQSVRDGRDAIGVIAALALRRFIEIDLDDARIGPETRVSRVSG